MSMNRNMITLMLILALIGFKLTNCQSDLYDYVQKRQENSAPAKFCGKVLSNTLQILCDGIYNKKKNIQDMDMNDMDSYFYNWPLRSRANAIMGRFGAERFRRQSRGIHDECCLKSCSISELKSYCAPPNERYNN